MSHKTIFVHDSAEAAPYCDAEGFEAFDPRQIDAQRPDAHVVVLREERPVGRCSLWWSDTPELPERRVGLVGHFGAADAEGARTVLEEACARLREQGCDVAVGPMDGNTWHRYRFVTERGPEPPFFLEPDNPDAYPEWFSGYGFVGLAQYYSALTEDLTIVDPRLTSLEQRAQDEGIVIRPLALDRFREELGVLYRMVLASFQRNFLYTPIAEADFIAQYLPLQAFVRPELVLFAERGGEGVGFVFALPDFAQQKRGEAIDTAIVKTIGVVPGRQNGGLGGLLLARCHAACLALGFKRAIHALMYESNVSRTLSSRYARSIRRYTLFQKDLRG